MFRRYTQGVGKDVSSNKSVKLGAELPETAYKHAELIVVLNILSEIRGETDCSQTHVEMQGFQMSPIVLQ